MAKPPVPTAKEINEAHQFAREHIETAVEWAVKCGSLLARKKSDLKHGEFEDWVEQWCEFKPRAARKYMQIAAETKSQNGIAVPFSSMQQALGYDKPKPATPNTTKGAVPVAKAPSEPPAEAKPQPGVEPEPEWSAEDEATYMAEAQRDAQARIETAMAADDKLAAAFEQIREQQAEIVALKASRDHYQRQAGEAVRLVKARDRQIARMEKAAA